MFEPFLWFFCHCLIKNKCSELEKITFARSSCCQILTFLFKLSDMCLQFLVLVFFLSIKIFIVKANYGSQKIKVSVTFSLQSEISSKKINK